MPIGLLMLMEFMALLQLPNCKRKGNPQSKLQYFSERCHVWHYYYTIKLTSLQVASCNRVNEVGEKIKINPKKKGKI
jgi:hypothetical protein